jgi:hypothetical protein
MKKPLIAVLVLVAALALCAPAMAWPSNGIPWWQPSHTFTATGKAQAIDVDASRLVLRVHLASRGVQQYLGEDLTVTITPRTQLLRARGNRFHAIGLDDIEAGDHVRVVGVIDRSTPGSPVYVAKRVIARHVVAPDELKRFAAAGPVRAVDAAGNGITIHLNRVTRALWLQLGSDLACTVAANAKIVTWVDGNPKRITLAEVSVGDRVVAQGSIDRTNPRAPVYTVKWVRVR